jgi:hypothetical protein
MSGGLTGWEPALPAKKRTRRKKTLLLGVFGFVHAYGMWWAVAAGREDLPWGSAVSGRRDDPHGDMQRLVAAGWSPEQITGSYMTLGHVCLAAILLTYGACVVRTAIAHFRPPPPPPAKPVVKPWEVEDEPDR